VNPNSFYDSFSGAEAPNVFMPMTVPAAPTKCAHPNVEASSTATRGDRRRQDRGPIGLVLLLEQLPRWHAHDASLNALGLKLLVGAMISSPCSTGLICSITSSKYILRHSRRR